MNPTTTAITPESIGANARCMYTAQGDLTCMAGNATVNDTNSLEKFTANLLHAEIPAWTPGNDPSARYLKNSSNPPPMRQTQPSVPAPSSGSWP